MISTMKSKQNKMNVENFQKKMDDILANVARMQTRPRLLLHSCCAPCSSYCLIYLAPYFDITCYYYNPNITEQSEYDKRAAELVRLCELLSDEYGTIRTVIGDFAPEAFFKISEGLESQPERGLRCHACYRLRLSEAVAYAEKNGFDYVTTSLTLSPLKSAEVVNEIGYSCAKDCKSVMWLPSDFKKKDGYKKSIELSKQYDLYRQNYCGCIYSKPKEDVK